MRLLIVITFALFVLGAVGFLYFDHAAQVKLDNHGLTQSQNAQIDALGILEPDSKTIIAYTTNESMMKAMSSIFISQCATCHGNVGTGATGPNLTDDYYLVVENVSDIYKNIKWGSIAKGMPPWNDVLTETELVLLTSYVAKLRGSSTEGKIPEGQQIEPWVH
jgi:cytochrome c oxidase cbb3-type subunit 3